MRKDFVLTQKHQQQEQEQEEAFGYAVEKRGRKKEEGEISVSGGKPIGDLPSAPFLQ